MSIVYNLIPKVWLEQKEIADILEIVSVPHSSVRNLNRGQMSEEDIACWSFFSLYELFQWFQFYSEEIPQYKDYFEQDCVVLWLETSNHLTNRNITKEELDVDYYSEILDVTDKTRKKIQRTYFKKFLLKVCESCEMTDDSCFDDCKSVKTERFNFYQMTKENGLSKFLSALGQDGESRIDSVEDLEEEEFCGHSVRELVEYNNELVLLEEVARRSEEMNKSRKKKRRQKNK